MNSSLWLVQVAKLGNMFVQMMADLGVGEERPRNLGDDGLGGHSSKRERQMGGKKVERWECPGDDAIDDLRREERRGGGGPGCAG